MPEQIVAELRARYWPESARYEQATIDLANELQGIIIRNNVGFDYSSLDIQDAYTEARKHLHTRVKLFNRSLKKARKKRLSPTSVDELERKIGDIVGGRVVLAYLDEVYQTLSLVQAHDRWHLLKNTENYIKYPQKTGYRGIHVTVEMDTPGFPKVVCEIQLKTETQHSWAQKTHDLIYKSPRSVPKIVKEFAKLQADLLHQTDIALQIIRDEIAGRTERR